MQKINLMYFKGVFLVKLISTELLNAVLTVMSKSRKLRLCKITLSIEDMLLKKRHSMNTTLKKYVKARLYCEPKAARKYILKLLKSNG